jgi:hypothetical protein
VIRFRFVEAHRGVYDVKRMCALVEVPRSSFYAWAAGPTAAAQARQAVDAELATVIEQVWRDSRRTYGWPRVGVGPADTSTRHGSGRWINAVALSLGIKRGTLGAQHELYGLTLKLRWILRWTTHPGLPPLGYCPESGVQGSGSTPEPARYRSIEHSGRWAVGGLSAH